MVGQTIGCVISNEARPARLFIVVDKATLDIQWTGNTKENMVWLAKFRKTAQA